MADFFRIVVSHNNARTIWSLSLPEKIAIAALCTVLFMFFAFAIRFQMRLRGLNDFRVSRGRLYNTVSKLAKRSSFFRLEEAVLYVIPGPDYSKMCVRVGSGVVLPLQFLDLLTREEIDVLAARQLCMESHRSYFRSFWILLGCNVAVVSLVQWLQLAPLLAFPLYLSLLTAEMIAFNRSSLPMLLHADLHAIQLTGNAEAYFSALGELSRFNGVLPSEPMLLEIGRATHISPERVKELIAENPTIADDRYPTTGSYMETGL